MNADQLTRLAGGDAHEQAVADINAMAGEVRAIAARWSPTVATPRDAPRPGRAGSGFGGTIDRTSPTRRPGPVGTAPATVPTIPRRPLHARQGPANGCGTRVSHLIRHLLSRSPRAGTGRPARRAGQ